MFNVAVGATNPWSVHGPWKRKQQTDGRKMASRTASRTVEERQAHRKHHHVLSRILSPRRLSDICPYVFLIYTCAELGANAVGLNLPDNAYALVERGTSYIHYTVIPYLHLNYEVLGLAAYIIQRANNNNTSNMSTD